MSAIDLSLLEPTLTALAPRGRTALLPALHAAQDVYGYLPEPVAAAVGRALRVPLSEVYGVIDFYSMFYREPVGRTMVRVCADPACARSHATDPQPALPKSNGTSRGGSSRTRRFLGAKSPWTKVRGTVEHHRSTSSEWSSTDSHLRAVSRRSCASSGLNAGLHTWALSDEWAPRS